jgi:hypothetical protein
MLTGMSHVFADHQMDQSRVRRIFSVDPALLRSLMSLQRLGASIYTIFESVRTPLVFALALRIRIPVRHSSSATLI